MTDTANLGLPFIEGSQAQKHVTHNESLRILDSVIQIAVLDTDRTAPPVSPAEGDRHIVAASPTGAWTGHAAAVAAWEDGAWRFLVPHTGWIAWSVDDDVLFVFDGGEWRDLRDLPAVFDHVGINASADTTNRLSVRSNAVLLTDVSTTDGGSGDVRLQLSKQSAGNTASVVFSNAFSGRAEFGLVGSDAFQLKVSPDGSSFADAFVVDQTTGNLTLPRALYLNGVISPAQITSNTDNYAPTGFSTASTLRLSTDASRNLTGIAAGADGRIIVVHNVGAQSLVLKNDVTSTAANRFFLGADTTLTADTSITLRYDGTTARWRAMVSPGSGGGGVSGDVVGPVSATDNAAARFDGATGKLVQDSVLIVADTTGSLSRSGNGGIPVQGTNTNNSAAAGYVGEYIESEVLTGSAVALTSGVTANITSISLTAGDWDVHGLVAFNVAVSTSAVWGGINTVSATLPVSPGKGAYFALNDSAAVTGQSVPVGMRRLSLNATTTVYLVARANHGGSTLGYGFIGARRAR